MGAAKSLNLDDFLPLREVGLRNLVGSHQRGLQVQFSTGYVKTGAGAETVTISAQTDPGGRNTLVSMAGTGYGVIIIATNDGAAAGGLAQTATTFNIPAGVFGDGDTLVFVIVGQIEDAQGPG